MPVCIKEYITDFSYLESLKNFIDDPAYKNKFTDSDKVNSSSY
jgi:hypothetical protein